MYFCVRYIWLFSWLSLCKCFINTIHWGLCSTFRSSHREWGLKIAFHAFSPSLLVQVSFWRTEQDLSKHRWNFHTCIPEFIRQPQWFWALIISFTASNLYLLRIKYFQVVNILSQNIFLTQKLSIFYCYFGLWRAHKWNWMWSIMKHAVKNKTLEIARFSLAGNDWLLQNIKPRMLAKYSKEPC